MSRIILDYDLSEACQKYVLRQLPGQVELHNKLNRLMKDNPSFIALLKEIVGETVDKGMRPIDVVAFSMLVAAQLGIEMERERVRRKTGVIQ